MQVARVCVVRFHVPHLFVRSVVRTHEIDRCLSQALLARVLRVCKRVLLVLKARVRGRKFVLPAESPPGGAKCQ